MSRLFTPATYLTLDGKRIRAQSALDLAERLWADARFTQATSLNKYMVEVSKRVWQYSGHNVRTASAFVFVQDMIAAGQLRILPEE